MGVLRGADVLLRGMVMYCRIPRPRYFQDVSMLVSCGVFVVQVQVHVLMPMPDAGPDPGVTNFRQHGYDLFTREQSGLLDVCV